MRHRNSFVILLIALLSACGQEPAPSATGKALAPEVEVFVVGKSDSSAAGGFVTQATLMVEHETDLLAEEEGRLLEVAADQGKRVRKNDLLARLDDSRLKKIVEQDRADARMVESQSKQAVIVRDAAEVELQRQTELRKEGLGSLRDFDRARFNLEAMKQEVDKARFDLERAKAKLEEDELRLSRLQIRAPYDGIVSRRYAREGQRLLQNEKILRVTELKPLLVRFMVPESLRRVVEEGRMVDVVPTDAAAGAARARVIRTGFVVDAASGSVECTAQLQEPLAESIVPGMAVEVRLPDVKVAAAGDGVMIPGSAIRRIGSGKGEVFVVRGSKLEKKEVQLGRESSSGVAITSGLGAGDRVVLSPQAGFRDGMEVRVRP